MRIGSPYTPGAGAMPPFLAGRDELLDNAKKYLLSMTKGLPQRPVIYYGLRGVGKTVLLNAIEEKADEMEALVNALHRVNQLRLPIMIFGAGLPKVLRILGEVKSYSERLFQYFEVGELSAESAREAIEKPAKQLGVEYTEQAVNEM